MIARNDSIKSLIMSKKYKYIILGGKWSSYRPFFKSKSKFISSIDDSIKLIVENGSTPIVILDTPLLPKNMDHLCTLDITYMLGIYTDKCKISMDSVSHHQKDFNAEINKLKSKYKQLVIINPKKALCNKISCNTDIDGIHIYADGQHMNYKGSILLGEAYLKKYGNPLSPLAKQ